MGRGWRRLLSLLKMGMWNTRFFIMFTGFWIIFYLVIYFISVSGRRDDCPSSEPGPCYWDLVK